MDIFSRSEAEATIARLRSGDIFIHPTDTIYGIGCDATNDSSVKKIQDLKGRESPLSVIAPSKDWIRSHCEITPLVEEYLNKLPGPFTLILKMKNQPVSKLVSQKTLGVRIPDHWISDLVSKLGRPIVTTSVNRHGEPPARTKSELMSWNADFIIYDGDLEGSPSTVIDLSEGTPVKKR